MLDSIIRPKVQKYFDKIVKHFPFKFLKPNAVSVTGCFLGVFSAILIYFQFKYLAAIFLLTSGLLDILDGTIARVFQKKSLSGCTIDIIFDRVIECSVIFALFFIDPSQRALVSVLLLIGVVMCLTSFFVVSMLSNNTSEKSFYYSPGICERGEAFIFFIIMIIFPTSFQVAGYIFSLLMILTAFIRTFEFLKQNKLSEPLPSNKNDE